MENEIEKREMRGESLHVLGDEESTLGDDTSENTTTKNHQRVLILLSIGERFVFFFLLGAERGDDCEVAERMTMSEFGGIFLP